MLRSLPSIERPAYRAIAIFLALFVPLLLAMISLGAANKPTQSTRQENILEVFVRDGCPHCAEAKGFLSDFGSKRPWLHIVYRPVDHDPAARGELVRHSQNANIWPPGVPTFVINGRVLVGFDDAAHTGPLLEALVEQTSSHSQAVETALFGNLSVSRLGLPLFTLAMGLLDGFNPCAMWVLLFLLSLLIHLRDRKRMALIAGTFVLASGAVYYAFMAAWLNLLLIIGISTALRLALGGVALVIGGINVKDFFTLGQGFSLSIPASAKPGLYARMRAVLGAETLFPSLTAVAILAVTVNFIELLCTAGFPALYTAVLTQQELSPSAHYTYLGLYILGYVADDSLMVATAVIALSSRKLTERAGRWLKLLSGVVMMVLGGVMILRPEWLI